MLTWCKRCILSTIPLGVAFLLPALACAQGEDWFRHNRHGNRYEGVVDHTNGLAAYKIVDFFASTNAEPFGNPAQLHILYFLPPRGAVGYFRVQERVDENHYLMQPIHPMSVPREWNLFSDWPVQDVLQPKHIRLDNLGILIRVSDTEMPDLLAPAILYGDKNPTLITHYTLDVFIDRSLSSLTCTLQDGDGKIIPLRGNSSGCIRQGVGPGTPSAASVRFTIPITRLPVGFVSVHLTGRYANDDSAALFNNEFYFYNQTQLPH